MPEDGRDETICVVMLDPDAPPWKPYQVRMVYMTHVEYQQYLKNKEKKSDLTLNDLPEL